jgi:hypothetical protein
MSKIPPITPKTTKNSTSELLLEEKRQIAEIVQKEEQQVKKLQEDLSWVGKMFFAGLAGALGSTLAQAAGVRLPFKLRGSPTQIKAITDAVMATKEFQEEISRPGATVQSVIQKLNLKNISRERFESFTGHSWPL